MTTPGTVSGEAARSPREAHAPVPFEEDLVALVLRAAELAPQLCGDCVHYHGSWAALRLTEAGGLEFDRPYLLEIFRDLARDWSRRRWLIAGMADTGLAAMVGSAVWPIAPDTTITLVDRCATPLTLCREYGARLGRAFRTVVSDLNAFEPDAPQDVIFAHSVLSHVTGDERAAIARRFRQWLAPGGCLVVSFRLNDALHPDDVARQTTPEHLETVIEALRAKGIGDEATLGRLAVSLARDFHDRAARRGAHATAEDLTALLRTSGFPVVRIAAEHTTPSRRLRPSGRQQRRAVLVAEADGPRR